MDIRSALRQLRRARWSTVAIIFILALGTGANSAVLALAYGIVVRPLPYERSSDLAVIHRGVSLQELEQWRTRLRTVSGLAAFATADHSLRGLADPRIARTAFVTRDFFDVLGVRATAGRTFDAAARLPTVVVRDRLAGTIDPLSLVGTTVRIADGAFAVDGFVADDVAIPSDLVDVWVPADAAPAIPLMRTDARRYAMLARLREGVTWTQLRDDVERVAAEVVPREAKGTPAGIRVTAVAQQASESVRPILGPLLIAATLVLLIACANVTSLLLSRSVAREHETAVSLALGASPARVLEGVLLEALILAFAASAIGIAIAAVAVRLLRVHAATLLPRLEAVRVDLPVLALALLTAALVAVACAAIPALHAIRRGLGPLVRQPVTIRRARPVTGALVIAQIALSIVVLVATGLLARTVGRLLAADLGIQANHVLTMKLMLGERTLLRPGERRAFVEDVLKEVAAVPGVRRVGIGSSLPPHTSQVDISIRVVRDGQDDERRMSLIGVRGEFLQALGARLASGRLFDAGDFGGRTNVVVISRSVADHLLGARDPVGLQAPMALPGSPERPTVVGVVDDVRYVGLTESVRGAVYVPWDRVPLGSVYLVVRTGPDPLSLAPAVTAAIRRLDGDQPIAEITALDERVESSIADRRLHLLLTSSFAVLAMAVAISGLIAALTRLVVARRREIAIRMALGATRGQTLGLIVSHAARLSVAGVLIGLCLAALAARGLSSRLFGVTPNDPLTYAAVAALFTATALLAALLPAYRAARLDPNVLLRSE